MDFFTTFMNFDPGLLPVVIVLHLIASVVVYGFMLPGYLNAFTDILRDGHEESIVMANDLTKLDWEAENVLRNIDDAKNIAEYSHSGLEHTEARMKEILAKNEHQRSEVSSLGQRYYKEVSAKSRSFAFHMAAFGLIALVLIPIIDPKMFTKGFYFKTPSFEDYIRT